MNNHQPTFACASPFRGAARIAIIYLVAGGLWFLFSGWLVSALSTAGNPALSHLLNVVKNWGFLIVTAPLLAWLFWREIAGLCAGEARYRLLAENSADVIWIFDPDTLRFKYVSPSIEQLRGYTADEVLAQTVDEILTPTSAAIIQDSLPERVQAFLAGSAAAVTQTRELEQMRKDGSTVWTEVVTTLLKTSGGAVEVLGVSRNISERKQTEEALRRSEQKFASAFRISPDAININRVSDGLYVDINEGFSALSGYTREEVIGKSSLKLNIWADPAERAQLVMGLQERGEVINLEAKFRRKDGTLITGLMSARTVAVGGELCILSITRDISDRKRVEAALQESEERLKLALDASRMGVWELDWQTDALFWSPECYEIAGTKSFDGTLNSFQNMIYAEDVAWTMEKIDQAVDARKAYAADFRLVRSDGEVRWISNFGRARYDETGRPLRLVGTVQDITERKQSEIERQTLLDIMQGGAAIEDLPEFLRLIHRSIARVIYAENFFTILYNQDTGLFEEVYAVDRYDPPYPPSKLEKSISAYVFRTGKPLLMDQARFEQLAAIGAVELVGTNSPSWLGVPLKTARGTIGVMVVQDYEVDNRYSEHDVDFLASIAGQVALAVERKRAEEEVQRQNVDLEQRVAKRTAELSHANAELERAARAKDEFLASMSHELRTPLNAILTLNESLQEGIYGPLNERQLKPLHTVGESGQHLLNLINDILDLSKIEAGKMKLQIAPVEVELVCQASLRLVRQLAQKKRLQVSLNMDSAVTSIQADQRSLKQMLVNLLSNAVKFTPEGGQVGLDVRGDAAQGVANFIVWDTGIGIAPEQVQRLFRPFVQIDSGLARQYGGTGLGLALVYRMAEMHGGGISLESTPGQGSRFTISLPWKGSEEQKGTGPLQPHHAPNVRHALVIEDSPTTADQLTRYLSELGARVNICPSGELALSQAIGMQPEVIFLDILLPDRSGWEVLAQLKEDAHTRDVPVIVLTVVDEPARGAALGAVDYIVKPLTRPRLYEALWKALSPASGKNSTGTEPVSGRRPVLLVAEDNPANQATYSDYLSARGYRVVLARNGAEAIDCAREERPDVILMDIQMPGMDGLEATRRLRADPDLKSIPIIALTALAMPGDRERCMAAGANDYLTKPASLKQLAGIIEGQLRRRGT